MRDEGCIFAFAMHEQKLNQNAVPSRSYDVLFSCYMSHEIASHECLPNYIHDLKCQSIFRQERDQYLPSSEMN